MREVTIRCRGGVWEWSREYGRTSSGINLCNTLITYTHTHTHTHTHNRENWKNKQHSQISHIEASSPRNWLKLQLEKEVCYTYLFMSLAVGQVVGCGIMVVTGTRVGPASHQEGFNDGGVARGGSLVQWSPVILSCCIHLGTSVHWE